MRQGRAAVAGAARALLVFGLPILTFLLVFAVTLAVDSGESRPLPRPVPTVAVDVQPAESLAAPAAEPVPELAPEPSNRADCAAIRGTAYESEAEREWFLTNCPGPTPVPRSAPSASSLVAAARPGDGPLPRYGTGDRLVVARLGISAPVNVSTVGVDGVMGNPLGPTDVVWYDFSFFPGLGGYPGQGGNAVFAGHVDYYSYGAAVFYQLRNVREGDLIDYYTSDGGHFRYAVAWFGDYPSDFGWASLFTGSDVITLITCNGDFNYSAREYSHRRVVRAARLQ